MDHLNLSGLRALVIEDECLIAADLKSALMASGAQTIYLSGDIDDAMRQIKRDGFEIALVDINLRGRDAFLVADELKSQQIPFAFVTGYDRRTIPQRFEDVPCWGKPFDQNTIAGDVHGLWVNGCGDVGQTNSGSSVNHLVR